MSPRNRQAAQEQEQDNGFDIANLKASAKRVTSRVWNPDVEDVSDDLERDSERNVDYYPSNKEQHLVGQLVGIDHNVGEHGSTMLRFRDPHGNEVATWQRGTLKTQVTEAQQGKYLLIDYKGVQPATRRGMSDMNLFDVYSLTPQQFDDYGRKHKVLPF